MVHSSGPEERQRGGMRRSALLFSLKAEPGRVLGRASNSGWWVERGSWDWLWSTQGSELPAGGQRPHSRTLIVQGHPWSQPPLCSDPKTSGSEPVWVLLWIVRAPFSELQIQKAQQWREWNCWCHTLKPARNILWILLYGFLITGELQIFGALKPVASHFTSIYSFTHHPAHSVFIDQDEWGEVPPSRSSIFTRIRFISEPLKTTIPGSHPEELD